MGYKSSCVKKIVGSVCSFAVVVLVELRDRKVPVCERRWVGCYYRALIPTSKFAIISNNISVFSGHWHDYINKKLTRKT